ncbi:hypothetical protein LG3211_4852 [Lysobacter gummosus]|nr:hypothetical protein LG3211_4852 [Lysobacter gummosus]
MINARRAQTGLTAHLILDGVCAWRVGNKTIAYEALTNCPAGRLLTKTFVIGRRRPAAVVVDAIAERHRQLTEAQIEK